MDLETYLYRSDEELSDIYGLFLELDKKLESLHESFVVDELDASKIIVTPDEISFNPKYIYPSSDPLLKRDNIKRLAKMTLGAYLTYQSGFRDYSKVDDEYFKINYEDIDPYIYKDVDHDDYYENLFMHNMDNIYHASYIRNQLTGDGLAGNSPSKARVKVLRNDNYPETGDYRFDYAPISKKSGFISILFYPFMLGAIAFILYISSRLLG